METYQTEAMTEALTEIRERSAYWLSCSDQADCGSPDSKESPGAELLIEVRDVTCDLIEEVADDFDDVDEFDNIDDNGALHEIADGAPSVYTGRMWDQFADLNANQEDPSELCDPDGMDMDKLAGICLYMIADRLARAIVQEVRDAIENAEAPDDDAEG